ncbi:integrase catalytic domain-containing protein [Trichonephila clavipes]|uniref:Integrase catalytic domain-containing protein n=1 Tax=Trichonephila clavipes TaxID=2585209 RepID=A0A8X6V2Q7_TRICX|nr:integrase catalytic domain-containing protein [Trichonephila clavipes]
MEHVPSDPNPADLVSRGIDPDKLLQQKLWFNGPTFLSGDEYPNRTINCREKLEEYNSELRKTLLMNKLRTINRFVENLKGISRVTVPLTIKEFEKAETFLVNKVQEQEFSSDINNLKTVHIELVSGLTSQAFIAALKRFMARRGKCAKLFSDNGKNFVGASNGIKNFLK